MQGQIAQIIALTAWGNAALDNPSAFDANGFFPANSTFLFCEHVAFVDLQRSGEALHATEYAPDPVAWFRRIKQEGVQSLRLGHGPSPGTRLGQDQVPDRMLVGLVGGGGRWLIEAVKTSGSDYWEGRWEVGDRNRTDRKIWRVSYGRIASGIPSAQEDAVDTDAVKTRLASNLTQISAFAHSQQLDGFAKAFDSALSRLSSTDPYSGLHHRDMVPPHALPPIASQLIAAVQAAWVFGGMGSWNDLGFDGEHQTRYNELSEQLYRLLNEAIVAAVNAR